MVKKKGDEISGHVFPAFPFSPLLLPDNLCYNRILVSLVHICVIKPSNSIAIFRPFVYFYNSTKRSNMISPFPWQPFFPFFAFTHQTALPCHYPLSWPLFLPFHLPVDLFPWLSLSSSPCQAPSLPWPSASLSLPPTTHRLVSLIVAPSPTEFPLSSRPMSSVLRIQRSQS